MRKRFLIKPLMICIMLCFVFPAFTIDAPSVHPPTVVASAIDNQADNDWNEASSKNAVYRKEAVLANNRGLSMVIYKVDDFDGDVRLLSNENMDSLFDSLKAAVGS